MKNNVYAFAWLFGLLLVSGCSFRFTSTDGYNFDFQGETATRQESGEVVTDVKRIEVKNRFGAVRVEGTDGQPGWSWQLTCWSDDSKTAETFVLQTTLRVQQEGSVQRWQLHLPDPPQPDLRGLRSDLVLRLPSQVHVSVENRFGDTQILQIQGGTLVRGGHGNMELVDLGETLEASNEHGDLKAERIPSGKLTNRHGRLEVRDASGDLRLDNAHGKIEVVRVAGQLEVQNQHGDVLASQIGQGAVIATSHASIQLVDCEADAQLENRHGRIMAQNVVGNTSARNQHGPIQLTVQSPQVDCYNQHGSIHLNLQNSQITSVTAETSHGKLQVELPHGMSPEIQTQIEHGDVHSDLPHQTIVGGDSSPSDDLPSVPRLFLQNRHGDIWITHVSAAEL